MIASPRVSETAVTRRLGCDVPHASALLQRPRIPDLIRFVGVRVQLDW